jgi:hypothetical protein
MAIRSLDPERTKTRFSRRSLRLGGEMVLTTTGKDLWLEAEGLN